MGHIDIAGGVVLESLFSAPQAEFRLLSIAAKEIQSVKAGQSMQSPAADQQTEAHSHGDLNRTQRRRKSRTGLVQKRRSVKACDFAPLGGGGIGKKFCIRAQGRDRPRIRKTGNPSHAVKPVAVHKGITVEQNYVAASSEGKSMVYAAKKTHIVGR